GLALEKERLQADLRARLAELHDSRARLAAAAEAERHRIERDLHDGTQQRLVSMSLSLGVLGSKVPARPAAAGPTPRPGRGAPRGDAGRTARAEPGHPPGHFDRARPARRAGGAVRPGGVAGPAGGRD